MQFAPRKRPTSAATPIPCKPRRSSVVLIGLCATLLVLTTLPPRARTFDLDLNELPPPENDESTSTIQVARGEPKVEVKEASAKTGQWAVSRWMSKASGAVRSSLSALPRYFDFEQFQRQFKRRYTANEFVYRKAAYLKRCFQVFKARVAQRMGQLGYSLGINKFADRSPNEIKQLFMSGPPIEFKPESQTEEEYYRELDRVSREREQSDLELDSRAAADGDESASEEEMHIFNELQARAIIEQLQAEAAIKGDHELRLAIRDELRGASSISFSEAAAIDTPSKPLPWPGARRSSDPKSTDRNQDAPYTPPELSPDDEGLDWSQHPCFHTIYDQGEKCGKCYAMASTSLAEFYKCSEIKELVDERKFSKKYVLDCGQKFSPSNLGCKGGSLLDTLRFIGIGGLYNIEGWKVHRAMLAKKIQIGNVLDKKCPFDRFQTPVDQWGLIKVEINPEKVSANEWIESLEDGPIVASVQMPSVGLESYEGGVHDGEGCTTSGNWHAMVLVGYGISHSGVPYWRFRNSWGPDWGDQGHFNLAMSVPAECLAGGVRVYREQVTA